jgi:hypothetical protein
MIQGLKHTLYYSCAMIWTSVSELSDACPGPEMRVQIVPQTQGYSKIQPLRLGRSYHFRMLKKPCNFVVRSSIPSPALSMVASVMSCTLQSGPLATSNFSCSMSLISKSVSRGNVGHSIGMKKWSWPSVRMRLVSCGYMC